METRLEHPRITCLVLLWGNMQSPRRADSQLHMGPSSSRASLFKSDGSGHGCQLAEVQQGLEAVSSPELLGISSQWGVGGAELVFSLLLALFCFWTQ